MVCAEMDPFLTPGVFTTSVTLTKQTYGSEPLLWAVRPCYPSQAVSSEVTLSEGRVGGGGGAHLPHLSLGWSVSEQQGTHSEDARGGDKLGGWH